MSSRASPPLALPPSLSPDDLDALSELSIVLAKVRAGLQSSQGLTTGATPGGPSGTSTVTGAGNAASAQQQHQHQLQHQQQLSFKDVPGATDKLKHKLQHARAQVRALPDMDRTIEEQQKEMSELEARIGLQKALLDKLRDGGVRFSKDSPATGDKMEI